MQRFEYHVVPAPRRGEKARGVKATEERFALALTNLMNVFGAEGWEYVRADSLPCDERSGLTGLKTTTQNVLVFRRAIAAPVAAEVPGIRVMAAPAPAPSPTPAPAPVPAINIPRLGAAEAPIGAAPAVGKPNSDLAAE
jgi:hypothetical protein